jgi:hypothetical protein
MVDFFRPSLDGDPGTFLFGQESGLRTVSKFSDWSGTLSPSQRLLSPLFAFEAEIQWIAVQLLQP